MAYQHQVWQNCSPNISLVSVIIHLLLSDSVLPKVITLSGAYCINKIYYSSNISQFQKVLNQIYEWGLGGWISWDQNRRSKDFAIIRVTKFWIFHEIKIPNNDLISWLPLFCENAFLNFDLMNNLLTKVGSWDQNYLNVLSCTCG